MQCSQQPPCGRLWLTFIVRQMKCFAFASLLLVGCSTAPSSVRQSGYVNLLVKVSPEGKVLEARVQSSDASPAMKRAAIEKAKTWTFEPRIRETWYSVPIKFELEKMSNNAVEPTRAP
jgi:TonB family protein